MKTEDTLGTIEEMLQRQAIYAMPQLRDLRRVPLRHRNALSLSIMSCCHCIVIGKAGKTLTVAFGSRENIVLINALHHYTGLTIFPVYVSPARLRLLMFRLNRDEKQARERLWRPSVSATIQVQTMLYLITTNR